MKSFLTIFKSIFFSTLTFLIVSTINIIFVSFNYKFTYISTYFTFLLGGLLNYFFYLKVVFKSYINIKRIFFIYWCFVPLNTILQTKIYGEVFIRFSYIPDKLLSFLSTSSSVIICYPFSLIFMFFLSHYAKRIKLSKH